jgi:hypothetical protein
MSSEVMPRKAKRNRRRRKPSNETAKSYVVEARDPPPPAPRLGTLADIWPKASTPEAAE